MRKLFPQTKLPVSAKAILLNPNSFQINTIERSGYKYKLRKIAATYFLCANILIFKSQTIYTFAGNGITGFTGDGGNAISASLNYPDWVAVDGSGNVYVEDEYNHRVRKISPTGIITTIAGNGSPSYSGDGGNAISAGLYYPHGITIDATGNLYIADTYNHCVRKVTPSSIITTIAGNGTSGFSGDGGSATSAMLSNPLSVASDASGNIYIADGSNNRIRKINTSGIITTIAGNGVSGYSGDGGAATSAKFNVPRGVTVDGAGNIYIADENNNRIRKINTNGIISTIAGKDTAGFSGDGNAATSAKLNGPHCIQIDALGNLYIADRYNSRIRKINTNGLISTIAGSSVSAGFSGDGGSPTLAKLNNPTSIALDASGNLFIADLSNHRVREVCQSACFVDIRSLQQDKIGSKIYPNPVQNTLRILETQEYLDNSKIEILNCLGQIILKTNYKNEIDISGLVSGNYILCIKYSNTSIYYSRFIKE